jgi:large subunit ribosomal protein LX
MSDVKIYRVLGQMLISHDHIPRWQKFSLEIRALKPEHAVEKAYSELGSRHKLRRKHIRIEEVKEISVEEARSRYIRQLAELKGWVR